MGIRNLTAFTRYEGGYEIISLPMGKIYPHQYPINI
jgi:hypothetical protein